VAAIEKHLIKDLVIRQVREFVIIYTEDMPCLSSINLVTPLYLLIVPALLESIDIQRAPLFTVDEVADLINTFTEEIISKEFFKFRNFSKNADYTGTFGIVKTLLKYTTDTFT
jgi:hypothetical protein